MELFAGYFYSFGIFSRDTMKTRNSRRLTFEVLEDRQLLAADVFATQPIADVRQLAAIFAPQKVSESEVRIDLAQKGLILSPSR